MVLSTSYFPPTSENVHVLGQYTVGQEKGVGNFEAEACLMIWRLVKKSFEPSANGLSNLCRRFCKQRRAFGFIDKTVVTHQ